MTAVTFYFTRRNTWTNFNNKNELYLYRTFWNFSPFALGPFVFWLLADIVDLCMAPLLLFLSTIPITEGFIQNMKQFFLRGNMDAFFLTNMAIWVQFFLTNAIWVQRICYFLVFFPWLDISNASQLARPVSQFCLGYFLPIS